jgi:hypothetical protein
MEYIALVYILISLIAFALSFMERSLRMSFSLAFFWPVWAVSEFVRLFIWTVKEIIDRFR